jgi:hypothetical protein
MALAIQLLFMYHCICVFLIRSPYRIRMALAHIVYERESQWFERFFSNQVALLTLLSFDPGD